MLSGSPKLNWKRAYLISDLPSYRYPAANRAGKIMSGLDHTVLGNPKRAPELLAPMVTLP